MADKLKLVVFGVLLLFSRSGTLILTTTILDIYHTNQTTETCKNNNVTTDGNHSNCNYDDNKITAFFLTFSEYSVTMVFSGLITLVTVILDPTERAPCGRNMPKVNCALTGISIAVFVLFFNSCLSGYRLAPYLSGILANSIIPMQFVTRFLMLKRKPTPIKGAAALLITLTVVVCLIPQLDDSLEPSSAHREDGGADGVAGRILWPLCMIFGLVPFAVSNTIIETSVQTRHCQENTEQGDSNSINHTNYTTINNYTTIDWTTDPRRISSQSVNVMAFSFWSSLATVVFSGLCFWVDLVPGFGTCDNWQQFTKRLFYNTLCLFGAGSCPHHVTILCWILFLFVFIATVAMAMVVKFSEGSTFAIVLLSLRTPLVFIFWSLFIDRPFKWEPHAHASTWFSLGSVVVMLPAILVYEKGDDWWQRRTPIAAEEQESLLVH